MSPQPKTTMERLLRLRQLEEDVATQELEAALAELRLLDQQSLALVRWRAEVAAQGMQSIAGGQVALWHAGEIEKEWSRDWSEQLRRETDQARESVVAARDRLLDCRSARMAVETLVTKAAAEARYEQDRRDQQSLDEWFQIGGNRGGKDSSARVSPFSANRGTAGRESEFDKNLPTGFTAKSSSK